MCVRDELKERALRVLERYPVRKAAFFGSVLSEKFQSSSDVDMLVEFLPGTPGLEFFGLKVDLEDEFNRPVDLLTYNALSGANESFKKNVERDADVFYIRADA